MNHSGQNGGKCKCGGKCQAATNEMLEWVRVDGGKKDTSKVPLVLVYAVVGLVFYYYAKKNKWLEA